MTIVTLIHGTWARKATWVNKDSPMAAAFQKGLSDAVQIEPFVWSGLNLHCMRRKAAANLQQHILTLANQHPGSRQFLVAHSHGGNVALYALANPEVFRLVNGTICLSTPFIHCRPRVLPRNLLVYMGGTVFILVCAWFRPVPADSLRANLVFVAAFAATAALMIGLWQLISYLTLGRANGSQKEIYKAVVDSFAPARFLPQQLLVLRAPGDEASAILGASAFATWLFYKLSYSAKVVYQFGAWLQKINSKLTWRRRVAGVFAAVLIGFAALLGIGSYPDTIAVPIFIVVIAILIVALFGFLLKHFGHYGEFIQVFYTLLLMPFQICLSVFTTPFGSDVALLASFAEFSAETTPVGRFWVINLSVSSAQGLWHSVPYNDLEAFEAIIAWINDRFEHDSSSADVIT